MAQERVRGIPLWQRAAKRCSGLPTGLVTGCRGGRGGGMGATWKEHERRTARAIGGRRTGPTGAAGPDVIGWDGRLFVECKHRLRLPGWLTGALGKVRAQAAAAGADRLGVVVLHELGGRDSYVLCSLSDWRAWFGAIGPAAGADDPGGA